ncbi:hypothetical protein AGLY_008423 [Aphis glycines]|uniref:Uncharacterized protein n=1 Tax=Aphis glycines TaxID=307491 RepID=A0A6G0TM80_APHGL|nr:hypothetical protein AGLY_008423 [Aphis glycines]
MHEEINDRIACGIRCYYNKMSLSEIMKSIKRLNVRTLIISKLIDKKKKENIELKIILIKKNLLKEINNIDKPKKKYEDEFMYKLYNNRKLTSNINIQFEEIQRLIAEKDDKTDFMDKQMKIINENSIYKKTTLLLKRLEKEKEDEYYKLSCKTLMINDILFNKINASKAKKSIEKNKILNEKYHNLKKKLKTVLNKVEIFKHQLVSYFDDTYDSVDKTEILKIIILTFNQLITNGYMCYWKSNGKIFKNNAELWTVHNPSGMHINLNLPITIQNNASISNFGGGFRWKSEYPWCIIECLKFEICQNCENLQTDKSSPFRIVFRIQ